MQIEQGFALDESQVENHLEFADKGMTATVPESCGR
jgi:hypothetical protein